jgi:hypothetical protein
MKLKFEIGQKVKCLDGEIGEVLSFSYSSERGAVYTVSSREVDLKAREVVDGIKTCMESELKGVK